MNRSKSNLIFLLIIITIVMTSFNLKNIEKINSKINGIEKYLSSSSVIINPQGTAITKSYEAIERKDFLKLIDQNVKILEIGPYYTPVFLGENIKYFDVLDKVELTKKAIIDKLDDSKIPDINYVEPNGNMDIIKEKFDIIFSSHNIEHQVDLINHFNQIAKLLNDEGRFYMLIPDKRYCFDHFVNETPLSEVIATHERGDKIHSLQTILTKCEVTHNNSKKHWQGDHGEVIGKDLGCYSNVLAEYKTANGNYIDSHKWRFTPYSFELIVNSLKELGLITLEIEKIYVTPMKSHEFAAILYKSKR